MTEMQELREIIQMQAARTTAIERRLQAALDRVKVLEEQMRLEAEYYQEPDIEHEFSMAGGFVP